MNADNTSKWKKSFSDTDNSTLNEDNDFQTKHMMHKIGSVKKKKKMKNYKNIPVLQSIHDTDPEEIRKIPIMKSSEGFEDKANAKPIIEGARGDINDFSNLDDINAVIHDNGITYYGIPDGPEFWDGLDEGDEGQNANDPRKMLIDALNAAYKAVNKFNRDNAKYIADNLSRDPITNAPTATDADVTLLQKYISYFESIICAYFFAYNIVYVSMYIDEEGQRIQIPRLTSNFFKDYSTKAASATLGMSYVAKAIVFFMNYGLYFSDIMQTLILDVLPEYFLIFLNAPAYMITVFICLIFVIENMVPFMIQFFTDVIMLNTTNSFVNMMYFFVIFMYIIECFGTFDVRTFTYSANNLMWSLMNPLTSLILGILQFIIVIMISVPVGAVLCFALFIFYAFSIFLYPITVFKFEKLFYVFGMFENIDKYLKRSFQLNFDPNDEDLDMVQKTQVIFTFIFDFVNSYIYYIANVVMLSFSTKDYSSMINSKLLRTNLLLINSSLLMMFIGLCINGFFSKIKVDRKISQQDLELRKKEKEFYEAQYRARQEKNKANLGATAIPPDLMANHLTKRLPIPSGIEKLTNAIPGFTKFDKMASAVTDAIPSKNLGDIASKIPNIPADISSLPSIANMKGNPLEAAMGAIPSINKMKGNPLEAAMGAIPSINKMKGNPLEAAMGAMPEIETMKANPLAAVSSAFPGIPDLKNIVK